MYFSLVSRYRTPVSLQHSAPDWEGMPFAVSCSAIHPELRPFEVCVEDPAHRGGFLRDDLKVFLIYDSVSVKGRCR